MKIIIMYTTICSFLMALLTGYMCRAFELWQTITASALTGMWVLLMLEDIFKNRDKEEQ